MSFAVIIPSFNRKELLARLLSQLFVQLETDDIVVVVNDGSTDGTSEMLNKEFPQVIEVLGDGNWWYTRSINEGLKKAIKMGVNHYLLLNDDIEIDQIYISTLRESASKEKKAIIGSLSVTYDKPHLITFSGVRKFEWWRYRSVDYHEPFANVPLESLSEMVESEFLPGRGMLIPAVVIEAIGLLDEDYVQYGSDDEICMRAKKHGFNVFVNWNAVIYSHHKLTGAGSTFVKESLWQHLSGYFNKYSRNYWKKYVKNILNYGIKSLFPLTILIIILGNLKSFFKYRFQND